MAVMAGLLVGYLLGVSLARRVPLGAEESVEWHWKRVNDFLAFIRDPQNLHSTSMDGINALTPPYDPMPSLIALEAAGEIDHGNLVLPNVPYTGKATRHWFEFCEAHRENVVYASGNHSYVDFKPSGDQPLHLDFWFKKTAKPDIQKLIVELEALAADGQTQSTKPGE